jgi:hypothetical protein
MDRVRAPIEGERANAQIELSSATQRPTVARGAAVSMKVGDVSSERRPRRDELLRIRGIASCKRTSSGLAIAGWAKVAAATICVRSPRMGALWAVM